MFERYLHHPAVRLAVPAIAVGLIYSMGEAAVNTIATTPVKNIPPAQRSGALPKITLPTVYVKGANHQTANGDADLERAFGAAVVAKDEPPPPPPPPPVPVPVPIAQSAPPLSQYFSALNIDGIGSEGIFVNGIFRKFGETLDVHIPAENGRGARSAIVEGLGEGGVKIRVGDEVVIVAPRF